MGAAAEQPRARPPQAEELQGEPGLPQEGADDLARLVGHVRGGGAVLLLPGRLQAGHRAPAQVAQPLPRELVRQGAAGGRAGAVLARELPRGHSAHGQGEAPRRPQVAQLSKEGKTPEQHDAHAGGGGQVPERGPRKLPADDFEARGAGHAQQARSRKHGT